MFGKSLQILTIYDISGLSIFIQPITKCKIDSLYMFITAEIPFYVFSWQIANGSIWFISPLFIT